MKAKGNVQTIPIMEDTPYFSLKKNKTNEAQEFWNAGDDGQLAVDVLETPHDIVVRSAIAGVKTKDLDIHVTHDTITIRGERESCDEYPLAKSHVTECHWGSFSRTVLLPSNVAVDKVVATMKNGVLTVMMPKTEGEKEIEVIEMD